MDNSYGNQQLRIKIKTFFGGLEMKQKLITICKYKLKFNYYVRDDGTIYSEQTNKILSPQLDKNGYEKIQMMSTDGKRHRYSVHRLVLENFAPVENMASLQVNHKDGNKRNNKLDNLEWVTNYENTQHAIHNKLRDFNGEQNPSAKLTEKNIYDIIELFHKGLSCAAIARQYGVCSSTIERIKSRKSWVSVTKNLKF
mgnify:CR=1 FL=1